jgi:hypothetical protein
VIAVILGTIAIALNSHTEQPQHMKNKLIGWALWIVGLAWPIHDGLLATEYAPWERAEGGNVKGLAMFILTVVLLFAGYIFYDKGASTPKPAPETSHH